MESLLSRYFVWLVFVCCIFFGIVTQAQSSALDFRLQALLAEIATDETLPVIVTFKGKPDLAQLPAGPRHLRRKELIMQLKNRAATTQSAARQLLQARGILSVKDLWIKNGLALEANAETIDALALRPEVLRIQYDEVIIMESVVPAEISGPAEANLELINAPVLWERGFAGQGVTVAIMDSGVDPEHPDLGSRWRGGNNGWYDPNGEHPLVPFDADGHGTGVLGVILGGAEGGSRIGVAPEARWIAVKIFNDTGFARLSNIHLGFGWLLDPDGDPTTDDAPDVVNNSWSIEDSVNRCLNDVEPDIQLLKEAGIAVVFAAGNAGPGSFTSVSPSNNPDAFAVGSVGSNVSETIVSNFSSRGPSACDGSIFPEIVAPGYAIRTADLTAGSASGQAYSYFSGTSIAAPHVSGAMALLLSAFPDIQPTALETSLNMAARDLGTTGPDNDYGYGLLDVDAAFVLLNDALLSITDSVDPPNDGHLPFGHIPVGGTAVETVQLQNDGDGFLFIDSIRIVDSTAFSIISNNCISLTAAESCQVDIRFAPTAHQRYAASLEVFSNGSASGLSSLELTGTGNTPPPAAQLISPENGEIDTDTTVLLQWDQSPDADGDLLTYEVRYATSPDLSQNPLIEVSSGGFSENLLLAGACGLFLLFGATSGRQKNNWRKLGNGLLFVTLLLLVSCGGGGGGGGNDKDVSGQDALSSMQNITLNELSPGTTYYWQVTTIDSLESRTESAIWSFTTK